MKPFTIGIDNNLLMELKCAGIEPDEVCGFLGQQVVSMQSVEPNYTPKQNNKRMTFDSSFWIMRGFYPGTPIMFKIILADTSAGKRESFYAKVNRPVLRIDNRKHAVATMLENKMWMDIMDDKANFILVGDDRPEPKVILTQRVPKCMSPKGVQIFNLNLKK